MPYTIMKLLLLGNKITRKVDLDSRRLKSRHALQYYLLAVVLIYLNGKCCLFLLDSTPDTLQHKTVTDLETTQTCTNRQRLTVSCLLASVPLRAAWSTTAALLMAR